MKELWNKFKQDKRLEMVFYGATGSLVATAIGKYSPEILSFLGEYTYGLLENFIDSRYLKAAGLEPTNYSFLILSLIFIIVCIAWFEISGKVTNALSKKDDNLDENEITKNNNEPSKWVPASFFFAKTFIYSYLAWGLLLILGEVMILNSITNFKQHIRIVTPYISQSEKDMLMSEWSQMQGLNDYNIVYEKLIEIAKENDLKLHKRSYH